MSSQTPEGDECIKAVEDYARRLGIDPTASAADLQARKDHRVIESMRANEWAAGLKRADDPDIQPGDVVRFGFDYPHDPSYGHVEVITAKQARHYRRQTLIQRLKSLFTRPNR